MKKKSIYLKITIDSEIYDGVSDTEILKNFLGIKTDKYITVQQIDAPFMIPNIAIGKKALENVKNGQVAIGEKALFDNEEVMSSINFTKKVIKRYIEMGCVPRMNGSLISLNVSNNLTCDCCGKKVPTLAVFENKHPHRPDIGLCVNCVEEYYKIINSHEQSTNETNGIY